ncbi:MAG: hypothetical protein ACPGVT_02775 [Maricaulaceae bacterium]
MTEAFGDKYAFLQLAAANASGIERKISKWKKVVSGIQLGELKIGSRTPVAGMPAWATPDVVRGGFATGDYAAGGPLLPHELALRETLELGMPAISETRTALNMWHMSDAGLAYIQTLIAENRYECRQAEEGALIAAALLVKDHKKYADDIIKSIAPFMDRLRFYPRPLDAARSPGFYVRDTEHVRKALKTIKPRHEIQVQAATLTVWIPLYDRVIDLLAYQEADNWIEQAKAWLYDAGQAKENTQQFTAKRWSDPKSQFMRCWKGLEALAAGKILPDSKAKHLKTIIGRYGAKYGSGTREAYREQQLTQNATVWFDAVAQALLARTAGLNPKDGIADTDAMSGPLTHDEAFHGAPSGFDLTPSMARKIKAAQKGDVDALIMGGQISSPEVLAGLIPQLTAQIHAQDFDDPAQGALYAEIFKGFHARRSLLLLNLATQVKIDELPWAKALQDSRANAPINSKLSKTVLTQLVSHSLKNFPQTQFPNPFVEQMSILGKRAKLSIPYVPEIAADIFMGDFSPRFEKAAQSTCSYYAGKLYARYYDLPEKIVPGNFAQLCTYRADKAPQGCTPAYNGMVLEHAMVLTSHNMAAVFSELDLRHLDYAQLAKNCFTWLTHRLSLKPPSYHSELISLKNAAYAWRQMTVFLSELPNDQLSETWRAIDAISKTQTAEMQERLSPLMTGMEIAIDGQKPSAPFLGWTLKRHPLAVFPPYENKL